MAKVMSMGVFHNRVIRFVCVVLAATSLCGSSAASAFADAGGTSPGDAPAPKPKPTADQESGGIIPGQVKPKVKPKPKPKPKPKVKKKPKKKAKKKPIKKKPKVAPTPVAPKTATFPVVGAFTYGDSDMRFGAKRGGHIHQGQDLSGGEGLPIVAPVAGQISWSSFQDNGAGYYLVLRGNDNRDYVFMHLRKGSVRVHVGDTVRVGQRLGDLGNTGHSTGPHLHFEIWVGGWYEKGGHAIDPLPQLRAWQKLGHKR